MRATKPQTYTVSAIWYIACYNSNLQRQNCSCQGSSVNNPALWSREKKMTIHEEYLDYMEKQVIETKEALGEFKK